MGETFATLQLAYESFDDVAPLMYNRWGFEDFGATHIQDGAVIFRVLAVKLGELRLPDEGSRQVLTSSEILD